MKANLFRASWTLALLLAWPAAVQAQCDYITNADNTITITKYAGSGAVVIPSEINGLPVTGIGPNAFPTPFVTSVTIPNTIANIGQRAFRNCTGLNNVT